MIDEAFEIESGVEPSDKVHERIGFEKWIYEHLCEMSIVQAQGNNKQYEMMLNTLMDRMYPYMTEEEKKQNEDLGKEGTSYGDTENYNRIRQKTRLTSAIMDRKGLQFTVRKQASIKGGCEKLWLAYPPIIIPSGSLETRANGEDSGKN